MCYRVLQGSCQHSALKFGKVLAKQYTVLLGITRASVGSILWIFALPAVLRTNAA